MADFPAVLMTVEGPCTAPPSIEQVSEQLHIPKSAIDMDFGVVLIDPDRKLYAVRVRKNAIDKKKLKEGGESGPFSDPRIAPFGPPER